MKLFILDLWHGCVELKRRRSDDKHESKTMEERYIGVRTVSWGSVCAQIPVGEGTVCLGTHVVVEIEDGEEIATLNYQDDEGNRVARVVKQGTFTMWKYDGPQVCRKDKVFFLAFGTREEVARALNGTTEQMRTIQSMFRHD